VALFAPLHSHAHHDRCHALRGARHWGCTHRWHAKPRLTSFVIEGRVSEFGYLTGDSEGSTADGGNTARPCIAIRDDATLGRWFRVTVLGHTATLLHCDWGPAAGTGRAIDITGLGAERLGFSPSSFPTEAWGVARELR
jgi:hypothetical protein